MPARNTTKDFRAPVEFLPAFRAAIAEGAGARYFSEKGAKPVLFNGDAIQPNLKQVIITEGEFDAMQLIH